MQISYFQKTSNPKKRVSLICLTHSFDRDLLNSWSGDSCRYESTVVGPLFPILTDCINDKILPTNVDSGPSFISFLAEVTKSSCGSDAPSHPMAKQAAMFTSLISDLLESSLDNSASVVPSLHALQQCLRSGWQPQSIGEEVVKVSIALLDSTDPSTSGVAFSLLSAGLIANAALSQQVLLVLLRNGKQVGLFAQDTRTFPNSEALLDKALCQFANTSYHTLLAQADATSLSNAAIAQSGDRRGPLPDAATIEKLSLGDNLEIWIGAEWVVGTIVKSNALTGELHVEHSQSGSPRTASTAVMGTVVSVVPKTSRKLRPVAAQRSPLSSTETAPLNIDEHSSAGTEGETSLPSAVPEYTEEEVAAALGRVVGLVFGTDSGPAAPATTSVGSLKRTATASPIGEDIPMCENDHRCKVVAISPSSAGFMCGVCSKLYSAGFDMSPPAGSDLPRFPPSRFGQAMYKWCCDMCQYDVCLACFPSAEYPAGGLPSYFGAESSTGHSSESIKRYTVDLTNLPSRNTSAKSISEGAGRPATRCTVCLMGQNTQSSCKVRAEASSTSAEISRVSHGSVIDVLDLPGSPFFQLFNGAGYVKKQPGRLCYWKRLPRDRYMLHSEEEVAYFSDTMEITPLMGALGPLGNSSSSGDSKAKGDREEAVRVDGVDVTPIGRDPAGRAVDLMELLVRRDNLLKMGSDRGAEEVTLILQRALSLFELTAEPLGEIVVTSVDCFEDEEDDFYVALDQPPAPAEAQSLLRPPPGVALLPQHGLLLLPCAAHQSWVEAQLAVGNVKVQIRERLALIVLRSVFQLVVETLTELAESRIAESACERTEIQTLALRVVALVAESEFKALLNAYFYRVLIVKASLRAKLSAEMFLRRNPPSKLAESTDAALLAFKTISVIESAYRGVLLDPLVPVAALFEAGVTDKLHNTICLVACAGLANGIIQQNHRVSALDAAVAGDFKEALKLHILSPKDRFAKASRGLRKLLKEICTYAYEANVSILEGFWREVVAEMVLEKCTTARPTPAAARRLDLSDRIHQSEARSDGLVDFLMATLSEVRYISRMDMAVTNQCCMSADLAFVMAFRRLPKDKSLELTKALVVRISTLIDSFKTNSMSRSWAQAVDNVADLIQVLFTQSSAEFQHFYELLLARRLLRNRYLSLSTEWRVLSQLPAMTKSGLMIRDIEQANTVINQFRSYLVNQIDFHELQLPRAVTELALEAHRLSVNVLTGNVWPSFWIRPMTYANLTLPGGLEDIKKAFVAFFASQNTTRFTAAPTVTEKFKTIRIDGSEENSSRINGVYVPTAELSDGWPIYEMRDSASSSILEYSAKTNSWQIKKRADRGKNAGWAYCKGVTKNPPELLDKPWYVWKKSHRKWSQQPIKIVCAASGSVYADHWYNHRDGENRSGNLRRIVWCHAAGTLTLQALLSSGAHAYLLVTEAQAAVLYSFNSALSVRRSDRRIFRVEKPMEEVVLSFAQLQASLKLTTEELADVISTLTSVDVPVLEKVSLKSLHEFGKKKHSHFSHDVGPLDSFKLSAQLLNGMLGGLEENNPIVLSSIELDKHHSDAHIFDAGVNSLYGWRNELVDAAIVRTLKDAAAQKAADPFGVGASPQSAQWPASAVPIDLLSYRVRTALKDHCNVSSEDIMRRSERLVSVGVINKVVGNADTFRSVAYCYLSDSEAAPADGEDLPKSNYVCDKVYGQDLFNHLRIVLDIKSLPYNMPGVSNALFAEKVVAWVMSAQCDLSSTKGGINVGAANFLDIFAGLAIEFLQSVVLQLNALQLQFWFGIYNARGESSPVDAFQTLPGLGTLQMLVNVLTSSNSSSNLPCVHKYLGLDRVYLEHLPEILVQDMMNYFRTLLKEPAQNYTSKKSDKDVSPPHGKLHTDLHHKIDADAESGRITPAEKEEANASGEGELSAQTKKDISLLWNRSAVVHRDALVHMFGFPESLLAAMGITSADESTSSSHNSPSVREELKSPGRGDAKKEGKEGSDGTPKGRAAFAGKQGMVRLSFQQLVAAVFMSTSAEATESIHEQDSSGGRGVSFGHLLDEYFFKRLVDEVAELFGTELHYSDGPETDDLAPEDAREDAGPEEYESMIPCEFCTDSIRLSQFEAHTIACRAGRIGATGDRRVADAAATIRDIRILEAFDQTFNSFMNSHRRRPDLQSKSAEKERGKEPNPTKRPDSSSRVAVSMLRALLDAVATVALDLHTPTSDLSEESIFDLVRDKDFHSPPREETVSKVCDFSSFVDHVFFCLDRDRDGFLSSADFAVVESSFADLADDVDPIILYGRPRIRSFDALHRDAGGETQVKMTRNPMPSLKPVARLPSSHSLESLAEEDISKLSTPVALTKTNSLWRSVSHEKSLPTADSSRSFSGLEEAEFELNSLVTRARMIIDDSEAATLSLLVHYKWDLKCLVEEYIENSRAVRFAVGLGPRDMPAFLRYDVFGEAPVRTLKPSFGVALGSRDFDSDDAHSMVLCGICQDTVSPTEAFALNCRHWFCTSCWEGYINNAINDRQVSYRCPQPDCRFVVTRDMQDYLCDDAHAADAKGVLIKSFVEDRRGKQVLATYCKNPRGCAGIVLMADDADYSEACCSLCSTTFCAACDMPPHAPATCDMVAKWEEKGGYIESGRSEDVEARKLKHLTTKPCPKCGVRIEKSGGCPHMTCVQPSCKYQFCWECAGEYHTSTTCSRPKVKIENNSVLAFDEFDRQCANHFLARKVALKGRQESHRLLEQTQRQEDAVVLRIIAEGWSVLADAQSALAHSCIVMLNVRSAKLSFLFECQKQQAVALQQKFEETWTSLDSFCVPEAKAAIRDLRLRLKDYLLTAHAEIVVERSKPKRGKPKTTTPVAGRSPARGGSSSASPSRRTSLQVSGQKSDATEAPSALVDAADQPMLELLQRRSGEQGLLSPAFMAEVASAVFGDAMGGSGRAYAPFAPIVRLASDSSLKAAWGSSSAKAEPSQPAPSTASAFRSLPNTARSPIGGVPLPVRAFGGIQAINFSSNAHPSRSLFLSQENSRMEMSPPPVSELRLPRSVRSPPEDSGEEVREHEEETRGDESAKRPRK